MSEVSIELDVPQHVLRFWESRFSQIRPLKRGGGRRYYRPEDVNLLRRIRDLLYKEGYTIKGAQKLLREAPFKGEEETSSASAMPDMPEALPDEFDEQEEDEAPQEDELPAEELEALVDTDGSKEVSEPTAPVAETASVVPASSAETAPAPVSPVAPVPVASAELREIVDELTALRNILRKGLI
ncbi:MAG: MerR family transcriptional regulator [Rhodospirillales bacterium]|nr:MerR family transcriptional regulator [Rhodospirillales bacterium]